MIIEMVGRQALAPIIKQEIEAKGTKKIQDQQKGDSVSAWVSNNGDDGSKKSIEAYAGALPELRFDKISEAKQKIESGFYDTEEFADALAEKLIF